MNHLFISYRRTDTASFVDILEPALRTRLRSSRIIFDRKSIPAGVDYRDLIARQIRDCDVILVVIGSRWGTLDKDGRRRLDHVDDPVRGELEIALQSNKHVMPVLIDDAEMPTEKDLPPTLKPLAYRNALRLESGAGFEASVRRVLAAIDEYRRPQRTIRRLGWTLAAVTLVSVGLVAATALLSTANLRANSLEGVTRNLGVFDGEIFTRRGNETLRIARAFPDREALDKAGSLKDQFMAARQSLDLFIFSGKVLAESESAMGAAMARGVAIRIAMADHGPRNEEHVARYIAMLDDSRRAQDWYRANHQSTLGILRRARETASRDAHPGRLEVREFVGPFASSFWVRDGGTADGAVAHIAITLYGDDRRFPAVRFGALSREVVRTLARNFDYLWSKSTPVELDERREGSSR